MTSLAENKATVLSSCVDPRLVRRGLAPPGGAPSPEKRPQGLRLRSFQWKGRDRFLFYVEKVHDV